MTFDITHLVTFIAGALTGATGHYLGEKFTDQRRKQEAGSEMVELMGRMTDLMPELISEMKVDISMPGFESVREFVVLPNENVPFSGKRKRYAYYTSKIDNLIGKVKILEHEGLVEDVSPSNTPIYKMSEEFVRLLKQ